MALTKDKILILKNSYRVTSSDLSHYKAGRNKHISKEKNRIISMFDKGEIMDDSEFTPFLLRAAGKESPKKYLVLRGLR